MIPSGSASSIGGAPAVVPSLLRSNSGLLGGAHSNSFPSHSPFPSLPSPRDQFNTNELLTDISNVSSVLNHSFVNGLAASGAPPVNIQNQGSIRGGVAEITGHIETNTMPFGQQFQKTSRNHHGLDHPHSQPHDGTPKFQQQFSVSQGQQQIMGGLNRTNNMPPVKLEPQMVGGDQNASSQQLQAIRNMGTVMKEHHYSDPSIIFQQQQHPFLHISNQSSQAASQMNLLQQQQRIQQQIVNTFADQYPQQQQQVHQQSLSLRSQVKPGGYEPGACAQRLTSYMYHQQNRPEDNNIEFWRKFVLDYFAPNAKKRWCVSLYGSGRQTTGIFPQDVWHCEICSRKPGRGFETTVEVLPRLCQIKYASGTLEELLYVDMPHEYLNSSGQVVLEYAKAIQETVFDQLRVVRDGQLRIVFNQDLKIASWEFCARRHEELIPRRLIIPQVSQLRAVLHKYQATTQNSSSLPAQDFQNICNSFVSSARQLAKALEVPLVNDLGYTKRYVRCLQISEVVNSMKDLIDYSKETGTGPMDSLINFPRAMNASPGFISQQTQQLQEQQYLSQNLNQSNQNSSHPTTMQIASPAAPIATSTANIDSILQNSMMSSKRENQMSTVCSPYGGMNTVQMPPASASISVSQSQHNLSSNNNPIPTSQFSLKKSNTTSLSSYIKQPAVETRSATNPNDSQSSVQQILHERLLPLHPNSVSTTAHELKGISGISRAAIRGGNCLVGNGTGGIEFGEMGRGITPTASSTGIRAAINSNALSMAGRVAAGHISENFVGMNHQLDVGSRLLGGLGAVNGFSGLQFD